MAINAISNSSTIDLMNTLVQSQSASTSKAGQTSAQKPASTPPAGAGIGVKAAASTSSTSSTSSSAKIYEAADTNKDGTVSFQEELLYEIQHPTDETEKQAEVSTSQMQSGLKSYKQGQQANSAAQSLPLFSI